MANALREQVVHHSGLSRYIAVSIVKACCEKAGVSAENLDAAGLRQILPELTRAIAMFKDDEFAEQSIRRISELVG